MPNKSPETQENELLAFRTQIDAIDDKLIALLLERTQVVENVGEYKKKTAAGKCPIRPGREATMLRRIIEKFQGTPFSPASASAIWRIIIGASTAVEADLTLSVFAPEKESDLFWLAREYFGIACPVLKQPQIKRVIGDVMDGKAAVGIVPLLRSDDTSYWWTNLMQQGDNTPKIFAHIPFVYPEGPERGNIGALAVGRVVPEPSGDDVTLIVLEAEHNTSQHRLQTAFATAKLEATWVNIATLTQDSRHHLIALKGFLPPESAPMQAVLSTLGNSILRVSYLGAYAAPISLAAKKTNGEKNVATAKA